MKEANLTLFNGVELIDEPAEEILRIIKEKRLPKSSYVVTPNADHFYRLDKSNDSEFKESYKNADLRICDSRIIKKLSLLEAKKINHVTPGSDLTKMILESSWAKNIDMLLVGPEPHEAETVKRRYNLPRLQHYTPPMGFIKNEAETSKCIDIINKSKADIVFLAVGSPQQEILANRVKKSADSQQSASILLCIGASFDFLSNKISRAPRVIQHLHLEWLHRALSDPKRLIPRYWNNFLWIISYIIKK